MLTYATMCTFCDCRQFPYVLVQNSSDTSPTLRRDRSDRNSFSFPYTLTMSTEKDKIF